MKRLGRVLHLSSGGNLILRTEVTVRTGTNVLGDKQKPVGTIFDIFGPVRKPYVSIKPSIHNPESYIGRVLYILPIQVN